MQGKFWRRNFSADLRLPKRRGSRFQIRKSFPAVANILGQTSGGGQATLNLLSCNGAPPEGRWASIGNIPDPHARLGFQGQRCTCARCPFEMRTVTLFTFRSCVERSRRAVLRLSAILREWGLTFNAIRNERDHSAKTVSQALEMARRAQAGRRRNRP